MVTFWTLTFVAFAALAVASMFRLRFAYATFVVLGVLATTLADCHLAVYGSLAPGEANAAQLESIAGLWSDGYFVTGDLEERGWGSRLGFPLPPYAAP